MTGGGSGTGSAGNSRNGDSQPYPEVPYGNDEFNGGKECSTSNHEIQDYNDTNSVRNCRLLGLRDLKGASEWVRSKIAEYMNKLTSRLWLCTD